eukprot:CAMPEP_0201151364 /NCGR_PEP_ID=MMETSP0851-20130426/12302_1 /ASSEMBLY_ACC=CAM_ASM_000631 /TAXON_ID=183588 /ORGANISM="Pseudo-nitzschia fraudulenta, Strain WWA7" /LENGTH=329 /DNA_ID=CAMNT_0047428201 /DNA_START=23 /DNA_END=1012 /DNA_ORIENTATION=-
METHTFDIDGVLKEAKERAVAILIDSDVTLQESLSEVQRARELASRAGLSVESCIVKPKESVASDGFNQTTDLANTSKFTGGHSNTDHVVLKTGDYRVDRIAELKRNLLRRHRNMQPEERGEDRWDKPKIPGERRRRIVRVQDRDICYPQEPPITGWDVFIRQMTTKIRHDRPGERHDQSKVLQEVAKIWRIGMSSDERDYYLNFATDCKKEYDQQVIEYRATGSYQPSKHFEQLDNSSVWIRKDSPNPLEHEISSYETCQFRKRPAELDEAYRDREIRTILRRKWKMKGLLNDDGKTWKNGLDFEAEFEKEKRKRSKLSEENGTPLDN